MKLGAMVGMRDDPDAFAAQARRLEDAGVDYLWTGEAYSADAVSTMGFLAAVTKTAQIGSSILPLYSRTPTLLAMTAVGLDKLSGGRSILGLGASGPQVIEGFHGVPYDAPVGRTKEIIEICRMVWRRDRVVHDGASYQMPLPPGQGTGLGKALKLMDHPVRERIPIYVASLGPKNVEMTAELAEGWLPLHYWPERAGELWRPSLEAGRARRSRPTCRPSRSWRVGRSRSATTSRPPGTGPTDVDPLLRRHGRQGQEFLQRSPQALRLRARRPSGSRTSTSRATARAPPRSCPTNSSRACPSSATPASSRTASPPTGTAGSPS